MHDVTRVLSAIERGEAGAADELLPLVYEELRKLASARLISEKPGQTLQATALVHEAYIRPPDLQQWFSAAASQQVFAGLCPPGRALSTVRVGGAGLPGKPLICCWTAADVSPTNTSRDCRLDSSHVSSICVKSTGPNDRARARYFPRK